MFYQMHRRLNSETGVNKPFENVSRQGRIQKFFEREGVNFRHFSSVFLPTELILSNLSAKNDSRGVRRHAPPEIFKNLHTAMIIFVLFEQFSRKVCHIFGP